MGSASRRQVGCWGGGRSGHGAHVHGVGMVMKEEALRGLERIIRAKFRIRWR